MADRSTADNDLNGNGLQEQRLLAADRASVYSKPDNTGNRSHLLNLSGTQSLSDSISLYQGNVYWRRIQTATYNGDVNDGSLDQSTYQPNANERAALTRAGYTGFPTAGENAANTPFPKWRCIGQALLNDEPAKCNGLINQSRTHQTNQGLALQVHGEAKRLAWRIVGGGRGFGHQPRALHPRLGIRATSPPIMASSASAPLAMA